MIETVIKRSGNKVNFDIQKIRNQINTAVEGTKVSGIELESKLSGLLKNNTSTKEIQELLVHTVTSMINEDNIDWILVAGRLLTHQLHREVYKNTGIDYSEFNNYLDYAIRNKYYRKDIKENFTQEGIIDLQNLINDNIKSDYDKVLPQVLSLKSKYLLKNRRGIIEYPLFSDMASSMILGSVSDNKMKMTKEYFRMLHKEYISLATPFKANLRREKGNTGSCFILPVGDSLEQLAKSWRDVAKISKEGGGVGIYLGYLRPGESYTDNIPKANNITRWVKIINDIAVAVNQRGIRPGAITPAIDWYHLDIESFIEVKTETGGDLRDKSFDIYPQVVIDRYFIEKKKNNEDVYLFNHFEYNELTSKVIQELVDDDLYNAHIEAAELIESGKLKQYKRINTKTLWSEFMRVWIEIGDFYIASRDNININNYIKADSIANSVNLCVESFSITKVPTEWETAYSNGKLGTYYTNGMYHSCNLISINVGIIHDDKLLERVCSAAVNMLDASIETGTMPVPEAQNSAKYLRNIGIGVVGLADWLAWHKLGYEGEENLNEIEKLQEKIAWYCYTTSIELAKEKGSYPAYKSADYSLMFGKTPKDLKKDSLNGLDWVGLNQRIRNEGIRNFLLLAIAPNTSTGIVMNSTASWLPPQAKMNYQTLADMNTPIIPRYLDKRYWHYKGKWNYAADDLLKVARRLQKWVDTGISTEVYINPELTSIKKISDEILDGFDKGEIKALYYSLTISAKERENCTDCAN